MFYFNSSGPASWNALPAVLRDPAVTLGTFRQMLKSFCSDWQWQMCIGHGIRVAACAFVTFVKGRLKWLLLLLLLLLICRAFWLSVKGNTKIHAYNMHIYSPTLSNAPKTNVKFTWWIHEAIVSTTVNTVQVTVTATVAIIVTLMITSDCWCLYWHQQAHRLNSHRWSSWPVLTRLLLLECRHYLRC